LVRLAQRLEVGQVLRAAARPLVADQRVAAEKRNREALALVNDAFGPGVLEDHPADRGEDVDP